MALRILRVYSLAKILTLSINFAAKSGNSFLLFFTSLQKLPKFELQLRVIFIFFKLFKECQNMRMFLFDMIAYD